MLTDRQNEVWELYKELGNANKVAKRLGIARQVVNRSIKAIKVKRAKMGITDGMDVSPHVGDGYAVKGVSTLVCEDGNAKL